MTSSCLSHLDLGYGELELVELQHRDDVISRDLLYVRSPSSAPIRRATGTGRGGGGLAM